MDSETWWVPETCCSKAHNFHLRIFLLLPAVSILICLVRSFFLSECWKAACFWTEQWWHLVLAKKEAKSNYEIFLLASATALQFRWFKLPTSGFTWRTHIHLNILNIFKKVLTRCPRSWKQHNWTLQSRWFYLVSQESTDTFFSPLGFMGSKSLRCWKWQSGEKEYFSPDYSTSQQNTNPNRCA